MKVYILKYSTINLVVVLFVFIIAFWGIRYNSDWEGYTHFYTHSDQSPDIAFGILSDIFNSYNFEYYYLYRFHIVVISLTFLFFISKFANKYLFVVMTILLFSYVALGNQIRYFVAFPLALLSVYYLFVRKSLFLHILLAVLSLLNHSAIIIFFLCFYAMLFINKYFSEYFIFFIVFINIISFFVFKIAETLIGGHFNAYFDNEQKSSLSGGIYSILQCVIILFCIYKIIKLLRQKTSPILKDRKFIFLYLLSFCSSFLIFPSLITQIINYRYISPLITVWIIFFLYIKNNEESKHIKRLCNTYIFIIILIKLIWVYLLPTFLLNENTYIIESFVMLNSYKI